MPKLTNQDIKAKLNFDTLFMQGQPLDNPIRKAFMRPENEEQLQAWLDGGWMDDLSDYLGTLNFPQEKKIENNLISDLKKHIQLIKSESSNGIPVKWENALQTATDTQLILNGFHAFTNYEFVKDPHFQALSGLIRGYKDIAEQIKYDERNENLKQEAITQLKEVSTLQSGLDNFVTKLNYLVSEAKIENTALDKDLIQKQIEKIGTAVKSIEESTQKEAKLRRLQSARLQSVPCMSELLSPEGKARLTLRRKSAFIDRMLALKAPNADKLTKDKKDIDFKCDKLKQKSAEEGKTLLAELKKQLKKHKGQPLTLDQIASEDPQIKQIVQDLSSRIQVYKEDNRISYSTILKQFNNSGYIISSYDDQIINEILKYEQDVLNSAKTTKELEKTYKDMFTQEEKGKSLTLAEADKQVNEANETLVVLKTPALTKLKDAKTNLERDQKTVAELEKSYKDLKKPHPITDQPFMQPKPASPEETAEITRQLDMLSKRHDICQGDHTNSPEYTRMIDALKLYKETPNKENMDNIEQTAQRYLQAKMKWNSIHLFSTKLRCYRLDYARQILEFAKQNKRIYEPAQFTKEETSKNELTSYSFRMEQIKERESSLNGSPKVDTFDKLILQRNSTSKEKMISVIDKKIKAAYEACHSEKVALKDADSAQIPQSNAVKVL